MAMRITGLSSGLDTESMVTELVKASSSKKENLVKEQTKLSWKQDAWKELNKKVYSFFNDKLGTMKYESAFSKKKTSVADSSVASVVTGENAVNGVQNLAVKQLAKTGYLTGGRVDAKQKMTANSSITTLTDGKLDKTATASLTVKVGDKTTDIDLTGASNISEVITKLRDAGVNANFDENNQRIFLSAKESGEKQDFVITAKNTAGLQALSGLGLLTEEDLKRDEYKDFVGLSEVKANTDAVRIKGQDAKISLNGAEFSSNTNNFNINGLTITANKESEKIFDEDGKLKGYVETSLTTSDDVDSIYDMIKGFLKDYNDLIKEMDTLYNAESARDYAPLTDEEKDEMSDTEVEDWEKKIKDSLLRKDGDLSTLINTFKTNMLSSYEVGGKKYNLASFGISTLGYFVSGDNEKGMFHIDGDKDDSNTSSNQDKLKEMLVNNPDAVKGFFTQMISKFQGEINTIMKHTDYRSVYNVYDDKRLKTQYDDYSKKIKDQEKKLQDMEDRYYDQFSAMESAMTKLNSQQSYLAGLFGGGA